MIGFSGRKKRGKEHKIIDKLGGGKREINLVKKGTAG